MSGAALSPDRIRGDFDTLARLAPAGGSGTDRFAGWLLSLVPAAAHRILDVGCGFGGLTWAMARADRDVIGVDLSPAMIERARASGRSPRVSFMLGDFETMDVGAEPFDCIVSVAALHHMDHESAVIRMTRLLAPGGRLIIQDIRRDESLADRLRTSVALAHAGLHRFVRTGWPVSSRAVRRAWARHTEGERYLSFTEARSRASHLLPGAVVTFQWLWRYTVVWDKPR